MNERKSGALLHITSLPSPFGIGDLGPGAYAFVDFLAAAKQSLWQMLPLNPTDPACGNSPYSSSSAFACSTLLISPERLLQEGYVRQDQLGAMPAFSQDACLYDEVTAFKKGVLAAAYENFSSSSMDRGPFAQFCEANKDWLDDFALFSVLKSEANGTMWIDWPAELRDRKSKALSAAAKQHARKIEREKFFQFLFESQWVPLKRYANSKGVELVGDIPIYVNFDSADVWTNPSVFKLDAEKRQRVVAGVPPDYFSKTGQLWGNPVYDWDYLKKTGFEWWLKRLSRNLGLFDVVRIDHFRGLVGFWEVPAGHTTAEHGSWCPAPADDFLKAVKKRFPGLPLIAEDLGIITDDVKEVMKRHDIPGMRLLIFAFGEDNPEHPYLPHNFSENCVVYTGTHDNNTIRGWYDCEARPEDKRRLLEYTGKESTAESAAGDLIRLAMMSVARTAIFPLQDILGLGGQARMNFPGKPSGNWAWRYRPELLGHDTAARLRRFTEMYRREPGRKN